MTVQIVQLAGLGFIEIVVSRQNPYFDLIVAILRVFIAIRLIYVLWGIVGAFSYVRDERKKRG